MAVDLNRIRQIAGHWKNVDPKVYEQFLRLLDQHVQEVTVAVTEAQSSDILQFQGRAQNARQFLRLFTETPS